MNQEARSATDIDRYIGRRIRELRGDASQGKIGEVIGVSFQQVQKYENGTNRISASRLYKLAQAFDRPIESFFP